MSTPQPAVEVIVRPLVEGDLDGAERIIRLAFGTFLGLSDPLRFMGDAGYAPTRFRADPAAALGAERNGELIGSNFVTDWGSFGFFGPLAVHPEHWNRGVAQQLVAAAMEIFRRRKNRHLGLFTFSNSPKHMALYQKFGFWPRDLVAIMDRELTGAQRERPRESSHFSQANPEERVQVRSACREVANLNFEGLDIDLEIRAVAEQGLGDTILLWSGTSLAGFAICHVGAGTEAGSGVCYVKFAAVRPGPRAEVTFSQLLDACEFLAGACGARKITLGVNLARREAFRELSGRGFRTQMQGVAMETGDASDGYNHAGVYILDDWR
jgi:GNAT superfamily N-acetyltransferase